MDWLALLGIVVAVVVPVGLAVHAAGRARSERNVKRLDDHIAEDVKAHERLARLETDMETVKTEVRGMRERYHDFRDSITRYIGDKLSEIRRDRDG